MAATRTTIRHQLNRIHELTNVQPRTALQTPNNLPTPDFTNPKGDHVGDQNPLANRIDAHGTVRGGETIHGVAKHITMIKVLNRPIHDTVVNLTARIATTVEAEDALAIVLDVMVNSIHIYQSSAMTSVQALNAVDET